MEVVVMVIVEEVVEVVKVVGVMCTCGWVVQVGPEHTLVTARCSRYLAGCLAANYRSFLCLQKQSYFKYFLNFTNKSFNHN